MVFHAKLKAAFDKVVNKIKDVVGNIIEETKSKIAKFPLTHPFKKAIEIIKENKDKILLISDQDINENVIKKVIEETKAIVESLKKAIEMPKPKVLFDGGIGRMRNGTGVWIDSMRLVNTTGGTPESDSWEVRVCTRVTSGVVDCRTKHFPFQAKYLRAYLDNVLIAEKLIPAEHEFKFPDSPEHSPIIRFEVDTKSVNEETKSKELENVSKELQEELDNPTVEEPEEESFIDKIGNVISFIPNVGVVKTILARLRGEDEEASEEAKKALIGAGVAVALTAAGAFVIGAAATKAIAGGGKAVTAGGLGKTALGVGTTLAGIDVLALWAASDNVISGLSFTARKLREGIKSGAISPEKALADFATLNLFLNDGVKFVKASVTFNPTLILFKEPFLINAEKGQLDMELEEILLLEEIEKFKLEEEKLVTEEEKKVTELKVTEIDLEIQLQKDKKSRLLRDLKEQKLKKDLAKLLSEPEELTPKEIEKKRKENRIEKLKSDIKLITEKLVIDKVIEILEKEKTEILENEEETDEDSEQIKRIKSLELEIKIKKIQIEIDKKRKELEGGE